MFTRLTLAVGAAAGCAVAVRLLAGRWPSAQLEAAGQARSAFRQAVAGVTGTRGAPAAAAGGTPATSGGVIPLETVPIDQLSDWELDLLTTPDA